MILIALLLGLTGSLHCAGMCAPLMMTVTSFRPSALLNRAIYNGGRILTYGLMGVCVGTLGMLLPLHEFQNYISVVLGVFLLLFAWRSSAHINIPLVSNAFQKFNLKFKSAFGHFIQRKSRASIFFLGALNGLLPCGLTFIALSYTVTLKNPLDAFYFMLLFGAGTLPIMLGFTSIISLVIKKYQVNMKPIFKVLVMLSGFILIMRAFIPHHQLADNISKKDEIVVCGRR